MDFNPANRKAIALLVLVFVWVLPWGAGAYGDEPARLWSAGGSSSGQPDAGARSYARGKPG